ncbi:hypothetical protein NUW54_g7845 [Trametes sanguinea]|uniref:Uncharacterized protein n=1 Tax=Trametes sanguinea TaxID=158606 RepID=A0ACC1PKR8_9APHY|nr:hypothetical protein NUW54_g7845 [Trametes sanguinea]
MSTPSQCTVSLTGFTERERRRIQQPKTWWKKEAMGEHVAAGDAELGPTGVEQRRFPSSDMYRQKVEAGLKCILAFDPSQPARVSQDYYWKRQRRPSVMFSHKPRECGSVASSLFTGCSNLRNRRTQSNDLAATADEPGAYGGSWDLRRTPARRSHARSLRNAKNSPEAVQLSRRLDATEWPRGLATHGGSHIRRVEQVPEESTAVTVRSTDVRAAGSYPIHITRSQ